MRIDAYTFLTIISNNTNTLPRVAELCIARGCVMLSIFREAVTFHRETPARRWQVRHPPHGRPQGTFIYGVAPLLLTAVKNGRTTKEVAKLRKERAAKPWTRALTDPTNMRIIAVVGSPH